MPEGEKMTFAEAMEVIAEAGVKGYKQGADLTRSREALRVVVAYKVKTTRQAKGMSQEELSERINTNILTYRGYENCKSDIPLIYLVRIADTLGVTLDYLAGRKERTESESVAERIESLEERLAKLEGRI